MLGKRLAKLRNEMKLTQEELAAKLNISRGTYAHYEIGKRNPDYETLQLLADFFGVTTDYLLGRDTMSNSQFNEVDQLVEHLHKRPELKMLFSKTKNATKEDIEKAASYIEFLKKQSEGDFDE